jgi:hypothetical protein
MARDPDRGRGGRSGGRVRGEGGGWETGRLGAMYRTVSFPLGVGV